MTAAGYDGLDGAVGRRFGGARLRALTLLFTVWTLPAHADPTWKVVQRTAQGYEIATREEPGRALPSLRARGELDGDILHLLAILVDAPRSTEWAEGADTVKIVRRTGPLRALIYTKTDLVWPVADRDVLMDGKVEVIEQGQEYMLRMRCQPEGLPPEKGVVRIAKAYAHFHLKKLRDGRVWLEYVVNVDPGGHLPTWLVRWASRSVPRVTLENLQQQLEKTRGQYAAIIAELAAHESKESG